MNHPRHRDSMRVFFRPVVVVTCSMILLCFYLFSYKSVATHFDWNDAFDLTRNSRQKIETKFLESPKLEHETNQQQPIVQDVELDYPLNSMVSSFFPIDAVLQFNTSDNGNITTHEMLGRYASFSPILNHRLKSQYAILPFNACDLDDLTSLSKTKYHTKVLIVLRGGCTFVDKVSNLLESEMEPTSILIANDEPYRGLITMFSNTFNQDGSLQTPIMFITNEDYRYLKSIEYQNLTIEISTAYIGSWLSIILSMVLSPPLLIILFYAVIICGQKIRRKQVNIQNAKMVKSLPIYIYNIDHLVLAKYFQHYLKVTGQSNMVPKDGENAMLLESPKPSPNASSSSINKIIVGGIDLRSSKVHLHAITAPDDFYPSYKCSICLEKYIPLKSKVLVLDCKHFFHEYCLSNWLINFKRSCPLCNYTLQSRHDHNSSYWVAERDDNTIGYGSMEDLEAGPSRRSNAISLNTSDGSGSDEESYLLENTLQQGVNDVVSDHPSNYQKDSPKTQHLHPSNNVMLNPPESVSSGGSNLTFYTANSQPIESSSAENGQSGQPKRPYLISKPLQILSRLSSSKLSGAELSASIDSGSDHNQQEQNSFESSTTSIVELDHGDELTINLSESYNN